MTIEQLIERVPELACMLALVIIFIRYLGSRDKLVNKMADECHSVQREAIVAIRENTERLGENTAVLNEVRKALVKFNGTKK